MILVDVYIPTIDEVYDVMLDENTEIHKVILEITEIVSKKMQSGLIENARELMLCHIDEKKALDKYRTLYMSGIKDGSRLMLV